jgi:hypothetical protein
LRATHRRPWISPAKTGIAVRVDVADDRAVADEHGMAADGVADVPYIGRGDVRAAARVDDEGRLVARGRELPAVDDQQTDRRSVRQREEVGVHAGDHAGIVGRSGERGEELGRLRATRRARPTLQRDDAVAARQIDVEHVDRPRARGPVEKAIPDAVGETLDASGVGREWQRSERRRRDRVGAGARTENATPQTSNHSLQRSAEVLRFAQDDIGLRDTHGESV